MATLKQTCELSRFCIFSQGLITRLPISQFWEKSFLNEINVTLFNKVEIQWEMLVPCWDFVYHFGCDYSWLVQKKRPLAKSFGLFLRDELLQLLKERCILKQQGPQIKQEGKIYIRYT